MLSLAVIFLLRKTIHFVESHMHVVMACVYSYNGCVVVYSYNACFLLNRHTHNNACVFFGVLIQYMMFLECLSF